MKPILISIIIGICIVAFGVLFVPYNVDEPKQCITTPCDQFRTTSVYQELSAPQDEIPVGKCPGPRILVDGICVLPDIIDEEEFYDLDICKNEPLCSSAKVTKIIDGDTIDVKHLTTGEPIRIRLSLIDTQERGEELYDAGKDFTANLCPVNSIIIFDQDDGQTGGSYDRVIGLVFCSGNLLNEELLETHLAVIDSRFCDISEYNNDEWVQRFGC